MTVTVCAKHEPYWDTGHLAAVVEEMRQQGAPTIRVMRHSDGTFYALEGSHRLHAAEYLKLEPKLVVEIVDLPEYVTGPVDVRRFPVVMFEHAHVLDLADVKAPER